MHAGPLRCILLGVHWSVTDGLIAAGPPGTISMKSVSLCAAHHMPGIRASEEGHSGSAEPLQGSWKV